MLRKKRVFKSMYFVIFYRRQTQVLCNRKIYKLVLRKISMTKYIIISMDVDDNHISIFTQDATNKEECYQELERNMSVSEYHNVLILTEEEKEIVIKGLL